MGLDGETGTADGHSVSDVVRIILPVKSGRSEVRTSEKDSCVALHTDVEPHLVVDLLGIQHHDSVLDLYLSRSGVHLLTILVQFNL